MQNLWNQPSSLGLHNRKKDREKLKARVERNERARRRRTVKGSLDNRLNAAQSRRLGHGSLGPSRRRLAPGLGISRMKDSRRVVSSSRRAADCAAVENDEERRSLRHKLAKRRLRNVVGVERAASTRSGAASQSRRKKTQLSTRTRHAYKSGTDFRPSRQLYKERGEVIPGSVATVGWHAEEDIVGDVVAKDRPRNKGKSGDDIDINKKITEKVQCKGRYKYKIGKNDDRVCHEIEDTFEEVFEEANDGTFLTEEGEIKAAREALSAVLKRDRREREKARAREAVRTKKREKKNRSHSRRGFDKRKLEKKKEKREGDHHCAFENFENYDLDGNGGKEKPHHGVEKIKGGDEKKRRERPAAERDYHATKKSASEIVRAERERGREAARQKVQARREEERILRKGKRKMRGPPAKQALLAAEKAAKRAAAASAKKRAKRAMLIRGEWGEERKVAKPRSRGEMTDLRSFKPKIRRKLINTTQRAKAVVEKKSKASDVEALGAKGVEKASKAIVRKATVPSISDLKNEHNEALALLAEIDSGVGKSTIASKDSVEHIVVKTDESLPVKSGIAETTKDREKEQVNSGRISRSSDASCVSNVSRASSASARQRNVVEGRRRSKAKMLGAHTPTSRGVGIHGARAISARRSSMEHNLTAEAEAAKAEAILDGTASPPLLAPDDESFGSRRSTVRVKKHKLAIFTNFNNLGEKEENVYGKNQEDNDVKEISKNNFIINKGSPDGGKHEFDVAPPLSPAARRLHAIAQGSNHHGMNRDGKSELKIAGKSKQINENLKKETVESAVIPTPTPVPHFPKSPSPPAPPGANQRLQMSPPVEKRKTLDDGGEKEKHIASADVTNMFSELEYRISLGRPTTNPDAAIFQERSKSYIIPNEKEAAGVVTNDLMVKNRPNSGDKDISQLVMIIGDDDLYVGDSESGLVGDEASAKSDFEASADKYADTFEELDEVETVVDEENEPRKYIVGNSTPRTTASGTRGSSIEVDDKLNELSQVSPTHVTPRWRDAKDRNDESSCIGEETMEIEDARDLRAWHAIHGEGLEGDSDYFSRNREDSNAHSQSFPTYSSFNSNSTSQSSSEIEADNGIATQTKSKTFKDKKKKKRGPRHEVKEMTRGLGQYSYLRHIRAAVTETEEIRSGKRNDPFQDDDEKDLIFAGTTGTIPVRAMYVDNGSKKI
eukprot:g3108.t1